MDQDQDLCLIQDEETGEDILVRPDGSHVAFPLGTLLPFCASRKIKLRSVEIIPLDLLSQAAAGVGGHQ